MNPQGGILHCICCNQSMNKKWPLLPMPDILLVSTALDPRFKDKFFSREAKKFAKKCIVDHCISFEGEDNGPQTKRSRTISTQHDTASSSKIWECFTEILQDSGATTDKDEGVEVMVDKYFAEPLIEYKTGNPYKWWNDNQLRYPCLANMAQRYLSALPTSVPSERLFSGAGNLYDEHRNKLSAEHAEMLLHMYKI